MFCGVYPLVFSRLSTDAGLDFIILWQRVIQRKRYSLEIIFTDQLLLLGTRKHRTSTQPLLFLSYSEPFPTSEQRQRNATDIYYPKRIAMLGSDFSLQQLP